MAQRVVRSLAKAIAKEPTPSLIAEFRQLLPAITDLEQVRAIGEAQVAQREALRKAEERISQLEEIVGRLLSFNGLKRPEDAVAAW